MGTATWNHEATILEYMILMARGKTGQSLHGYSHASNFFLSYPYMAIDVGF